MKTILLGVSILVCQMLFKRIFQPRKNHGSHFCISTFDLFFQRSSFKFAIQKRLGDQKMMPPTPKKGALSLYLHTFIYIYRERERCIYMNTYNCSQSKLHVEVLFSNVEFCLFGIAMSWEARKSPSGKACDV